MKRDGFEKMRYKKEDIVKAIHLHNEGLSLFQVKDYLWQHEGVKVTRQAIGYWCNKYSVFLKSDK
jgi:transposase-like protein